MSIAFNEISMIVCGHTRIEEWTQSIQNDKQLWLFIAIFLFSVAHINAISSTFDWTKKHITRHLGSEARLRESAKEKAKKKKQNYKPSKILKLNAPVVAAILSYWNIYQPILGHHTRNHNRNVYFNIFDGPHIDYESNWTLVYTVNARFIWKTQFIRQQHMLDYI